MRNFIRFYLNGEEKEIRFCGKDALSPLSSVLDWLRNREGLKGTKEGCGAGECGACTLCLAEEREGKTAFYAVNACLLLLPMADGKSLFTIEYLSRNDRIHPIQQAMFEKRGAQCGFCSPGMIMSAYAHYRNGRPFTREAIETALSGNLCRCTGYESILEAMMHVADLERIEEEPPRFPEKDGEDLLLKKGEIIYFKPATLKTVLELLKTHPEIRLITGATDLKVALRQEKVKEQHFLDISDLEELRRTEEKEGVLRFGSAVTIEAFKEKLSPHYPAADAYLDRFASLQIRNKGTLGGSLSNSSPVGDIMPLLLALDAQLTFRSVDGERRIDAADFNLGYRKNALRPEELLAGVEIPLRGKEFFLYCHKQANRKNLDIATLSMCLGLEMEGRKIVTAHSGFGGMDAVPRGCLPLEELLTGKVLTAELLEEAGRRTVADFHPLSDVRGSAEYRLKVINNLFIKVYEAYRSARPEGL